MTLRRYGASHGVGLLHRLAGLEGTYAVSLTALDTYLQQLLDATVSVSLTRFALDGADESLVRRGFECMRCTKTASSDALNDRHRAGDRGRNGAISAEALVLDHYGLG